MLGLSSRFRNEVLLARSNPGQGLESRSNRCFAVILLSRCRWLVGIDCSCNSCRKSILLAGPVPLAGPEEAAADVGARAAGGGV